MPKGHTPRSALVIGTLVIPWSLVGHWWGIRHFPEGALMAVEIKVPAVGESVTEGTLARWLKPDGATVVADEPLCELETDKATQEVYAPAAGVLRIAVKEGERVAIGTVVGRIEEAPAGAAKPQASPNGPK